MKKSFFKDNWLLLLIVAQPVLDILAYWTRSPDGTAAGVIRLFVMLLLPLGVLVTQKESRLKIILSMAAIGLFCALHAVNNYLHGYINMVYDISYMAKTAQLPIAAISLCFYIRDEKYKASAMKGFLLAAGITFGSMLLAYITGTANSTYGPGLGISGWVIDDNRCANSIILVTMAVTAVYFAVKSDNILLNIFVPALTAFALIVNGTKACYYSVFAICAGFIGFIVLEAIINRKKLRLLVISVLLLTAAVSAAVYPLTPRYKVNASLSKAAKKYENEIVIKLTELGYDLYSMTDEEKLNDPVVVGVFGDFYKKLIVDVVPDMFDRFSYEEILTEYGWETDSEKLINTRVMKIKYVALIWKDLDLPTRLFGMEVSDPWFSAACDLENDWPALYYYYGYVGIALYAVFILYFVFLILRLLLRSFKAAFTLENFCLLMMFMLHMGLAQFSGAVLRRPNVSIYTAVIMALIFCKAAVLPENKKEAAL